MGSDDNQLSFDFEAPHNQAGYAQWQTQRRSAMDALAQKLGLPLGRQVEVWLRGGVRLRGRLLVHQLPLFPSEFWDPDTPLYIGRASFSAAEIESCLLLEDPKASPMAKARAVADSQLPPQRSSRPPEA